MELARWCPKAGWTASIFFNGAANAPCDCSASAFGRCLQAAGAISQAHGFGDMACQLIEFNGQLFRAPQIVHLAGAPDLLPQLLNVLLIRL